MTENVLNSIIENKRIEVDRLHRDYERIIVERYAPRNTNSFENTLQPENPVYRKIKQSKPTFILECKRGSPSQGLIRKRFDIKSIVSIYNVYADVISVVTDEKFFWGSYEFLKEARAHTDLPILCKDFIIDEIQLKIARSYGADMVLLMLSVLDDHQYEKLRTIAANLGMEVLTEVHIDDELNRALVLGATIIGINNRNLIDLSVNLSVTKHLSLKIPSELAIISESGISNYQHVQELQGCVDGFLIGSSLMRQADIKYACNRLFYGENSSSRLPR